MVQSDSPFTIPYDMPTASAEETMTRRTRREFLGQATVAGAAALVAGRLPPPAASQTATPSPWASRIGLELYTVRDLLAKDYEGTLAKVAAIGYTEVEPTSYNNLSPTDFRALLDRHKLSMPSTHAAARGTGADLEKQLEGFQVMGIRYTEIVAIPPGAAGRGAEPARPDPRRPATIPPGGYYDAGSGRVRNSFKETEAFGPYQVPGSLDAAKRRAGQLNTDGKIAQKFGIKLLVHNHTVEFEKLTDSTRTLFDVLVEETDPALVTMQLDLGWTYIAGVDPLALFKAHPGRFELWHVKDVFGLKTVNPSLSPNARVSSMALVPVGSGHIDFKPVFAQASLAGLKHFVIEQDNAAAWGDSLAAARVSCQGLKEMLG
jgi:sugar phosphate isomerase/epimerase